MKACFSSTNSAARGRALILGRLALGAAMLAVAWGHAAAAVDGARAMQLIRAQCAFGPRIPGTQAHEDCRAWIVKQFKDLGTSVTEQTFQVTLPLIQKTVTAQNIWVLPAADGPTSPAVLLSAHWDTRPFADQDPSGARPMMLGADDGASGVALLIEIARQLRDDPLRPSVAIALWDAEDSGLNEGPPATWGLGSLYAAGHQPEWMERVKMGMNLDMVGGADFNALWETDSLNAAQQAWGILWRIGRDLHPELFTLKGPAQMTDDHTPWNEIGAPFIDLIGWPYAYWHTAGDTPTHCSPTVLSGVGEVVMQWLHEKAWEYPSLRPRTTR